MTAKLSDELQQAIDQHPDGPVQVVDPRTNTVYYLVTDDQYQYWHALTRQDDFDPREAYEAADQVARGAGWDDPAMDAYNDSDADRPTP